MKLVPVQPASAYTTTNGPATCRQQVWHMVSTYKCKQHVPSKCYPYAFKDTTRLFVSVTAREASSFGLLAQGE